jgi:hypothetical protein
MSACTRATRTRSAGFGWLARVRRAWISQAARAAPRRVDPELDGRYQVSRLMTLPQIQLRTTPLPAILYPAM